MALRLIDGAAPNAASPISSSSHQLKKCQRIGRGQSVALPAVLLSVMQMLSGCDSSPATAESTQATAPPTLWGGAPCGACIAPAELKPATTIASSEPGEKLEISGTILRPDGSPADGFVLFVYHTDATGFYNEKDNASDPRLRGWMKVGADGKYQFTTIKPAPYPHRSTPAHIHAHVYGPGYTEHWIDDYWFEGDPFINDEARSLAAKGENHPVVIALHRGPDDVLRGTRDIPLAITAH